VQYTRSYVEGRLARDISIRTSEIQQPAAQRSGQSL